MTPCSRIIPVSLSEMWRFYVQSLRLKLVYISYYIVEIEEMTPMVKVVIMRIIHGPKISNVMKTMTILGIKASVCSFIWVAA
jgi:hypothetical protein